MNPDIQQWAQSAEAQPYLQARGINIQQPQQPQMGGYGMGGGGNDQYGMMLKQMFDSSVGNPKAQNAYLNEYLGYIDPRNQPDQMEQQYQFLKNQGLAQEVNGYQDENNMNLALSLLSSEDPELMGYGKAILQSIYPEFTGGGAGAVVEKTPYDLIREAAANNYGTMAGEGVTNLDSLNWQKYLSSATDEQIQGYNKAPTFGERINDYTGDNKFGRGVANTFLFGIPGFIDMLGGEDIKKRNAGYNL